MFTLCQSTSVATAERIKAAESRIGVSLPTKFKQFAAQWAAAVGR
jgi:hypothetical protein